MRKISYVSLVAVLMLAACKQDFKKGEMGLEYKIISGSGSGPQIKTGEFMQIQLCQMYNNGKVDSIMNDTRTTSGPVIETLDSASMPPAYFKILSQIRKNDSLVIRVLTDSAFKDNIAQMPPFFQKGHYLITTAKVLNIFKTREEADSARQAEMVIARRRDSVNAIEIQAKDSKTIEAYLAKNNIKAVKAPMGTYVEILQPGTGPNIDTSNVVKTFYTGKTMDGKIFDSNTDPSKGKTDPLLVNLTNDYSLGMTVIKGWTDGMKLLNKGAKARFYIPSPLAYGKQQQGPDIKPNSILMFDIEIADVLNRDQANAEKKARMDAMKEKRKRMSDSLAKVQADTAAAVKK
jgi:FKBP-type peptidyl-prolyl cis-trans isomerase FkpA